MNNQLTIISHAVFIGLTPLIPIPVVDDLVKSFFQKRLVSSLADSYHLSLSPAEIDMLAEERGEGCINGCVNGCAIGLIEYLVKRLIRKVIFLLEWRRAINLVTHAYYIGHLMDYAFAQGWYVPGDVRRAIALRTAIEWARRGANTDLVKRIIQSSFDQSRAAVLGAVQQVSHSVQDITLRRSRIWLRRLLAVRLRRLAPRLSRWLYRRLRPVDGAPDPLVDAENVVAQTLERESPGFGAGLQQLIATLQDRLAEVPQSHFEILEQRLAGALKLSAKG